MKYLRPILCAALLAAACCVPDRRERTVRMPEPPAPECIRLLFGGDVMQHLPQIQSARRNGGFDYRDVFAALEPRFRAADLVVVNLETTLADAEPYAGYPVFRSPAALADALHEAGVDIAVLANNHCCDGGLMGIRTTVRELERCGIRHTGVFRDSADYRRNHPLLLRRGGISIALLNYTYGTNGMPVRPVRSSTASTPRPWRATWPQHGTPVPTASPSASTGATSTNAVRTTRSGCWPAFCGGTAPTSLSAATRTSCSPTRPTRPRRSSIRWEISSRTSAAGTATAACWPRSG